MCVCMFYIFKWSENVMSSSSSFGYSCALSYTVVYRSAHVFQCILVLLFIHRSACHGAGCCCCCEQGNSGKVGSSGKHEENSATQQPPGPTLQLSRSKLSANAACFAGSLSACQ